jgi:transposase-like protein
MLINPPGEVSMPRSCPPEFRSKVLDLLEAGRTVAQVAHDLQISDQTIYTWRRKFAVERMAGLEDAGPMGRPKRASDLGLGWSVRFADSSKVDQL